MDRKVIDGEEREKEKEKESGMPCERIQSL